MICSKFSGSIRFNGIPREGNLTVPIQSNKDQCRDHMIKNGLWDVLSLPEPRNQEKKWYLFLNQYRFPLNCAKLYVKGINQGSKADKYMFQNLTCSLVYLRSTFPYALLKKVLKLVPLTEAGNEVYVATMDTVLSNVYAYFQDNLNHLQCTKIRDHLVEDVEECYYTILVDAESLDSSRSFNVDTLGYFTHTFVSSYLINKRRLKSLLRNFTFLTRIPCDPMSSLTMGPLFERLWVNTITFSPHSGQKPFISKKSIKMSISLLIFPLGQFKIQSSRLKINLIPKSATVGNTMTLVDIHLPSQSQVCQKGPYKRDQKFNINGSDGYTNEM